MMDGHFVGNIGIPLAYARQLAREQSIPLEAHLMVTDPLDWLPELFDIGVRQITVHYEIQKDVYEIVRMIKNRDLRAGIALRPYTPIDFLEPFMGLIDSILLMAYTPGSHNQEAFPGFEARIQNAANLARKHNAGDLDIAIDGNVNEENIGLYSSYGANFFILGTSGLFLNRGRLDRQLDRIRRQLSESSKGTRTEDFVARVIA